MIPSSLLPLDLDVQFSNRELWCLIPKQTEDVLLYRSGNQLTVR
jgi:hypothetical protein